MSDNPRDWILPYPWPAGAGLPDSFGLTQIIPSYLYDEYSDDDDLQAFVSAYNSLAQQFLDWFNDTLIPIYTRDAISGLLLDWVGAGLYGLPRPTVLTGTSRLIGPYATAYYGLAPVVYGAIRLAAAPTGMVVDDDIYKRILTWHFFKGDGKYFTITWLKKRIMRFLLGVNGTAPNIDQSYQISVTFGPDRQANIVIYNTQRRTVSGPGVYGMGRAYGQGPVFAYAPTVVETLTPFAAARAFEACINSGVLELPFQWSWTITVIAH